MVSADQVAAIKASWPALSAGDGGAQVGLDMFIKYFTDHPEMKAVFGYSEDIAALKSNAKLAGHGKKVMEQIGTAVAEIDDLGKMTATLKALGVRHKGFGDIKAEYFPTLGVCLLAVMKGKVPSLDESAWAAGYKAISDAIISGIQS